MSGHLKPELLALAAGGELPYFERLRVEWHLRRCDRCREEAAEFRRMRERLRADGLELPPGVSWARLSEEMRGNILVGLDAAACVAPVVARPTLGWRPAVAIAALGLVIVTGWMLNAPRLTPRPIATVEGTGARVELTPTGVEYRQGAQGFALLNPRANRIEYAVNPQGARAQSVDVETGQMTITQMVMDGTD